MAFLMGISPILLTAVLLLVRLQVVTSQGEFCYTPAQEAGSCVFLNECPYLVQIYTYNPRSKDVINYLIASQVNCGRRSVNRNPIVCCGSPVFATEAPPPTTTTTTTPEPPPPQVPVVVPHTNEQPRAGGCFGPDGRNGECRNIRECPLILAELQAQSTSTEYAQYLRNSNGICLYVQQHICCPTAATPVAPVPLPTQKPSRPPVVRSDVPHLLSTEEGCGFSNFTTKRIVGGEPAERGSFPWIALLGYTDQLGEVGWKCGGSLITSRHVLSAAHCLKSSLTTVRLGEHDIGSSSPNIIDVNVVKVARYETYTPKDGHNDLSILYLEHDVPFSDFIRPICIPVAEPLRTKNFVGYTPIVAGWGRTTEGGTSATILQQVQLPVLGNDVCKDRYKKLNKLISEQQFDDAVLCAGDLNGGKDSCQGDSGGPLMSPTQEDGVVHWYQIGVVSYGVGCARADVPGVYSKVQHFVDWIEQKIAE